MYATIKEMHSFWAYAVLGLLVIAILNSVVGLVRKKPFTANDRKIALFALIFSHIQLLFGLIMLFTSPYLETAKQIGMGAAMKDSTLRLYIVEHPFVNIIAIVLITMGWSKHKKAEDDTAKFKKIAVLYAIGLVLLLSMIPWSTWLG
ncbi:hypothetical protein ACLI08_03355 [Flavobacterium sp. RNTU_13]|uniref:hypothetical protein n=1 Tax=Flavobacterium sp. RNTU_13 TaxID=3375145 RepID=UPI0039885D86